MNTRSRRALRREGAAACPLRSPFVVRVLIGRLAVALPCLAALVAACSGKNATSGFDDPSAPDGPGATTAPDASLGPGRGPTGGLGTGDASPSPLTDAACASEQFQSNPGPVDLYIMLDQSGSMNESGKWANVTGALKAFTQSSEAAGIGVGIQYFPVPAKNVDACTQKCTDCVCVMQCGCSGCSCTTGAGKTTCSCPAGAGSASCSGGDYAAPDVPIAPLPGSAAAIGSSIDRHSPLGGTPTHPALEGAIQYAQSYAAANPGHKVNVVLATDGEPNECNSTVANVAQLAQSGTSAASPVLTFVIGVGSDLAALNQVAQAGGTTKAFLVDASGNATKDFLDALDKIRSLSISCEYAIPTLEAGTVDPSKVNVQYVAPSGTVLVGQVTTKNDCDPTKGGWYFDDPAHPRKIELCEASCKAANSVSVKGQVDVVYGCETIKQPPPR